MTDFAERLEQFKEQMGSLYLMHPDNTVKKKRLKKTTFEKFVAKTRKKQK